MRRCYKEGGGCGPYEGLSCSECPAGKPSYLRRGKARTNAAKPAEPAPAQPAGTASKAPGAPAPAPAPGPEPEPEPAGNPAGTPADPLTDARADGPVVLTAEETAAAGKAIRDTQSQLAFLAQLIERGLLYKADADTHLKLFRYAFDDLAKAIHAPDVLNRELEDTRAQLRAANGTIRDLRDKIGDQVSGDAVHAGISRFEELFRTWYAYTGFHYAHIEYSLRGLTADFSSEIDMPDEADMPRRRGNKPDAKELRRKIPFLFGEGQDRFDIAEDGLRKHLLDTDKNRAALLELFRTTFPGSYIRKFESTDDRNQYLLGFEVFVEYSGIEAWQARVLGKPGEKNADGPEKDGDPTEKT